MKLDQHNSKYIKINRKLDADEEDRIAILTAPENLAGIAILRYATERVFHELSISRQQLLTPRREHTRHGVHLSDTGAILASVININMKPRISFPNVTSEKFSGTYFPPVSSRRLCKCEGVNDGHGLGVSTSQVRRFALF